MDRTKNLRKSLVISLFLLAMVCGVSTGKTINVDADAPPGGDGLSWTTAYQYLQDALWIAISGDQIRVADGIYKPDQASNGGLDAFVANSSSNKIWINEGQGVFYDSGQSLGSSASYAVASGDLDSDGDLDAFVANNNQANKIWLNDGQGHFSDSGQALGDSNSYDVELGNVDGDGDLDAFVANSGGNKIWINDGQGVFYDSGQILSSSASYAVALGDLDGDEDLDAFVANCNQANKIWFNDGQGVFNDSGQSLGSSASYAVASGDLDGDGDLDAFVANNNQSNKIWLNDGQGHFSDSGQALVDSNSYDVELGDLDGDGDLDAFVANSGGNKIWFNDGQGVFNDSGQSLGSSASYAVASGDLDGDGDLDAFVANNNQSNKIWLNDGQGHFTDSGQVLGDSGSRDVELGDMDGDLDAFVANVDRAATFQLKNGITIKGGYAGFGAPDPNARDIDLYKTILSGDLNGDDGPDFTNNADNSYHVVTASGCDLTAVLDGFTITAGNANEDYPSQHANGGGMYNNTSSPTVTNCTFTGNRAGYGGGMLNSFSNPTVKNCTFNGNTAGSGGGMGNESSNLTVSNCIFSNNTSANLGGGMYNYDSSPIVTNSSFIGNSASFAGGGMCNLTSGSPTVSNCTFSGNSAGNRGGGIGNFESDPFVTNCILWGDTPDEIWLASGTVVITYSDVQGGWIGTGNINSAPCFVDANNPDPNLSNYRLSPESPCIDAGDGTALMTLQIYIDLDGKDRYVDIDYMVDTGVGPLKFLDIGTYEFHCSGIPGDINCDGVVNFKDVAILCGNWLAGFE